MNGKVDVFLRKLKHVSDPSDTIEQTKERDSMECFEDPRAMGDIQWLKTPGSSLDSEADILAQRSLLASSRQS